jgi:asparagine synthase (glutamine-hydrolysing)
MCGIWFCTGVTPPEALDLLEKLKARGPEGTRTGYVPGMGTLGFTRLAINGLDTAGMQPMNSGDLTWVCNGEIYNWRSLAAEYGIKNNSGSDCEILGELYNIFCNRGIPLEGFFRALDGVFAMVIVDEGRQQVVVARDPYGVRPLYTCRTCDGQVAFASELKALPVCDTAEAVPPGSYTLIQMGGRTRMEAPVQYHTVPFLKNPLCSWEGAATNAVRAALLAAVKKRMMTERPVAALLSGGLDSSLIAALVAKELQAGGAAPLQTFSVGMKGSSDLAHARLVADWIGSKHTEVILTPDEFFAAVPEVIRCIESYDTTTVRASVGNWLVAKAVAATDCKVVFNGDGADEVWGSYLYFYSAPSDHAFEEESGRLLQDIHMFDVLRSDRCVSVHGLEPRTPYLDREFVGVARSIATELRRPSADRCEKWLMRKAFEDQGLLPPEVLWRRKEAFSDGVSGEKSWYQIAQEKAEALVGDEWREAQTSKTAEQYYYRKCFLEAYGPALQHVNVPYFWMPRWSPGVKDPSARALANYSSSV